MSGQIAVHSKESIQQTGCFEFLLFCISLFANALDSFSPSHHTHSVFSSSASQSIPLVLLSRSPIALMNKTHTHTNAVTLIRLRCRSWIVPPLCSYYVWIRIPLRICLVSNGRGSGIESTSGFPSRQSIRLLSIVRLVFRRRSTDIENSIIESEKYHHQKIPAAVLIEFVTHCCELTVSNQFYGEEKKN